MSGDVPFTLNQGEKLSPLWARLRNHLEDELTSARKRNDNPKLSADDTAALRGEIKQLKAFIALGNEDRPQTE